MADSKRARSWKRRTLPRIDLTNAEPVLYSTPSVAPLKTGARCQTITNPARLKQGNKKILTGTSVRLDLSASVRKVFAI